MSGEMDMLPLIRTKLHRPRVADYLVVRPRLLEHLHSRRRRRLTVVAAPAGYGKTTLVSSWLEESDWPCAWLSLDEYDDDLVTFLSYVVAAFQAIFPDAGRETQSLLKASTVPPTPVLARQALLSNTRATRRPL